MRNTVTSWPRYNASDLIARRILYIGDGYRAKNSEMGPTGLPFARAGNINGGFLFEGADLLDESNIARSGDKVSLPGDIVFTSKGTVGRFALVRPLTPTFVYSPQLCFWRVLDKSFLDPLFLFYWMQSFEFLNQVQGVKGLTDMADYVSLSDQRRMLLTVPSLSVQHHLASILAAYDELIENNTRRIKILEEMAQMLYREWFISLRFPGHESLRMIDSALGLIPEGWTASALETVCTRVTDGSHWSPKSVENGRLMASSKDMHKWGLDLTTCRHISAEDYESLVRNDCQAKGGDVLITKDGANYLKHCFVVEKDMDVVLLSSIAIIRPDPARASCHYIAFHLSDKSVKTRLAGRVSGAAIPRIVLQDFREFVILIPPISIQSAFVRIVEPMISLCWRLIDKNKNLRNIRDFLLPKLISGELPVEAAVETAAQLIEATA